MCIFPLLKYITEQREAKEVKKIHDISGTPYEL